MSMNYYIRFANVASRRRPAWAAQGDYPPRPVAETRQKGCAKYVARGRAPGAAVAAPGRVTHPPPPPPANRASRRPAACRSRRRGTAREARRDRVTHASYGENWKATAEIVVRERRSERGVIAPPGVRLRRPIVSPPPGQHQAAAKWFGGAGGGGDGGVGGAGGGGDGGVGGGGGDGGCR